MINKAFGIRVTIEFLLIFLLCLMTVWVWGSYVEIDRVKPDTFEMEALKVDVVFNFVIASIILPVSCFVNRRLGLLKLPTFLLGVVFVGVLCLHASRVSKLVGGIL